MHYVTADKISKSYGIKPLLSDITFHISGGDKIALIARNGSGKSTLLKILAGKDTVDEGTIWIHKDVTVALFEQEPQFAEELSVLDNIFHYKHPVAEAMRNYEKILADGSKDHSELSAALARIDELGAWDFEAKVHQILNKLNIDNLDQKVKTLSGGQRKRVALAQMLILDQPLLLMDEPFSALDVQTRQLMENELLQQMILMQMVD